MAFTDIFGGGGGADYSQAINALQGIRVPRAEEMRIELQELVSQGQITPEQAENILQQASEFEDISGDPLTREAQMKSLLQLQDVGEAEGLDPVAQAQLYEAQETMRTTGRGAREAAMQRAQERGIGGSGLELANVMQSTQAGAQQSHRDALQAAAEASKRGLEAIYTSGQLGGQIRGQDWQQEAEKAAAADAINRFNVESRQRTQESNIGRRESAQYANLGEKQRLADYNVAQEMENRRRNADLIQQQFESELSKGSALSNIYGQQAQSKAAQRAADQAFWGGMIGTGATLAGTAMAGPVGGAVAGGMTRAATQPRGGAGQPTARPAVMPRTQTSYGPNLPQNKLALNYGTGGFDPNKKRRTL